MTPSFQQGDFVVYPTQGVAEVLAVEPLELAGLEGHFYELRCVATEKVLRVPTANAEQVGLRPLASAADRAAAEHRLTSTPAEPPAADAAAQRLLEQVLAIQHGTLPGLAEVVRDLHHARRRRPLTQGERRVEELALRLLVQELAWSGGVEEDAATARVEALLG